MKKQVQNAQEASCSGPQQSPVRSQMCWAGPPLASMDLVLEKQHGVREPAVLDLGCVTTGMSLQVPKPQIPHL